MAEHRIVHASDLHLGDAGGDARATAAGTAWERFAAAVERESPDLVVLSGDLVVDDPDDERDQALARALIDELSVQWAVVPGNHDVGDHAVRGGLPHDWHGKLVTDARVAAWERRWGASYWLREIGEWCVLGLNSQLMGTQLERDEAQWRWLNEVALPAIADRPAVVFAHESLSGRPDARGADPWTSIPDAASARLDAALRGHRVALVGSGHTHRYLEWTAQGRRNVTAPSLAGPIPYRDDMHQADGDARPGWLEYRLGSGRLVGLHHRILQNTERTPTT